MTAPATPLKNTIKLPYKKFYKPISFRIFTCELTRLVGVNASTKFKMKSKTKISKQIEKKKNPELVSTIIAAKKNENWKRVAEKLCGPRKNRVNLNLNEIKFGEEIIVVPGKILSLGEVNGKGKVVAFSFSKRAKEKLKKASCEVLSIVEEIKKNPQGNKIKILE